MDTIKKILNKYDISEKFDNAKKMDKENRIFISENYVVKIFYPNKYSYYYNELEVYKNLNNKDYLPKLYYYGEEETYKYIIISRLKGNSLFDSWNKLSNVQKESSVRQIAKILKDINEIRTSEVDFKMFLNKKFSSVLENLSFSGETKKNIENIYNSKINYIKDMEKGNLIHIDVHFYNFFINSDKVFAYDFENMIMAPLDYQLLRWYRMWKYPETFIYPKNSLSSSEINSYQILMPILLEEYPSLMCNDKSDDRIKLYSLIYLLEEAKRCKLAENDVLNYIDKNKLVKIKR